MNILGFEIKFSIKKVKKFKQTSQYDFWKENHGYDDDPDPTWEEFKDKNIFYCERCDGWFDDQCICYAR